LEGKEIDMQKGQKPYLKTYTSVGMGKSRAVSKYPIDGALFKEII
jgi:hypothetical protein